MTTVRNIQTLSKSLIVFLQNIVLKIESLERRKLFPHPTLFCCNQIPAGMLRFGVLMDFCVLCCAPLPRHSSLWHVTSISRVFIALALR